MVCGIASPEFLVPWLSEVVFACLSASCSSFLASASFSSSGTDDEEGVSETTPGPLEFSERVVGDGAT